MKTLPRIVLSSLVLILVTITAIPVAAQDNAAQTVTVSEAALNATLTRYSSGGAGDTLPVESLSLNLRDMEIILVAEGTRPNGQSFSVEGVIVPSVADTHLYWTLASLETVDANGIVSPRDPASGQATGKAFIDIWEHAFTQSVRNLLPYIEQDNLFNLRSVDVLSATVSEDAITIEFRKGASNQRESAPDPLAGAAGQDGTSNTIMITEVQANDALAAFARRNERVESMTVDFTPDGVKVEAQIVTTDGQTVGIIAILIGLLLPARDGQTTSLAWTFYDVIVSSVAAGDVNNDVLGEIITNAWSRFVELQINAYTGDAGKNEVSIESLEVTNTSMIIAILIGL
ncbi:MAG: hypothetical protein K8L91_13335 [Anaerolineae bacterium]|nr:hypothetical protein [Anaerolineae bacterium]